METNQLVGKPQQTGDFAVNCKHLVLLLDLRIAMKAKSGQHFAIGAISTILIFISILELITQMVMIVICHADWVLSGVAKNSDLLVNSLVNFAIIRNNTAKSVGTRTVHSNLELTSPSD